MWNLQGINLIVSEGLQCCETINSANNTYNTIRQHFKERLEGPPMLGPMVVRSTFPLQLKSPIIWHVAPALRSSNNKQPVFFWHYRHHHCFLQFPVCAYIKSIFTLCLVLIGQLSLHLFLNMDTVLDQFIAVFVWSLLSVIKMMMKTITSIFPVSL